MEEPQVAAPPEVVKFDVEGIPVTILQVGRVCIAYADEEWTVKTVNIRNGQFTIRKTGRTVDQDSWTTSAYPQRADQGVTAYGHLNPITRVLTHEEVIEAFQGWAESIVQTPRFINPKLITIGGGLGMQEGTMSTPPRHQTGYRIFLATFFNSASIRGPVYTTKKKMLPVKGNTVYLNPNGLPMIPFSSIVEKIRVNAQSVFDPFKIRKMNKRYAKYEYLVIK